MPHAGAEADYALDAIRRQERITEDGVGLLADTVDAARALDEPDDGPGQIEVDDDGAVLEILALAEHIGREDDPQFVFTGHFVAFAVADRAETVSDGGRVFRVAGDSFERREPSGLKLLAQIVDGVGKLGEEQDFVRRVPVFQKGQQGLELGVAGGVPAARVLEHLHQGLGVFQQVFREIGRKQLGLQPFETAAELGGIGVVNVRGSGAEFLFGHHLADR
ncbi:MAG: hypothetical protein BWX70_02639 [Verrucomicrobia bacterium ADurb.Bin070]|nr:MAG: hypothetical protein BWX70_02639 [Verrucomicrobia bacterium ADurb.Bin070]